MIAADALAPKPHTPLHPLNTVTEACAGDLALVCVGAQGDFQSNSICLKAKLCFVQSRLTAVQ